MTRKTVLTILAVAVAFAVGFTLAARMTSSGGEVVARDVVAAGGGQSTATSGHALSGTIGQPIAGVSTSTEGYILVGGFQTMGRRGPTAVRNWELY